MALRLVDAVSLKVSLNLMTRSTMSYNSEVTSSLIFTAAGVLMLCPFSLRVFELLDYVAEGDFISEVVVPARAVFTHRKIA